MTLSLTDSATGFDRFGLDSDILRGVRAAGFLEPRPIQVETIPEVLAGRDVLGLAQTGTGKTAAFALPLLHRLTRERRRGPRVLVLAPTRELATQIAGEFRTLARFTELQVVTIYGGVSAHSQIKALRRNPQIVVGCPGRVLDLIGRSVLHLGGIESVVIDEADHMFDMGFLPDLRRILATLPSNRQNLLFSATMPKEIRTLADKLLRDPHVVELGRSGPAETIDHFLVAIREDRKRDLLERILAADDCESAIVFTRTKHRARRLAKQLDSAGHRAVGLQGNMSQSQRDRAMQGFRKGRYDVLVATDIAARGIDVQGVSHVINFDVPGTPDAYTHRIGRTGRAEREGRALTFVTRDDGAWLRATERKLGNRIPRQTVKGFEGESIDSGGQYGMAHQASGHDGRGGRSGNAGSRTGSAARSRGGGQRRPGRSSARRRRRRS